MISAEPVFYYARLEVYQQQAETLFHQLMLADDSAQWRFKWSHPRFRGRSVADVEAATLDLADAQEVIAQENGFDSWSELTEFVDAASSEGPVARFEAAVELVISGDVAALRSMLGAHRELARARSLRRHHATLLHYIAANGVENWRQKTPENAVEIARTLLDSGAEVDALAEMYGTRCSTLNLLVSSGHAAEAGLQTELAETLLDHGAVLDASRPAGQSAILTALAFGYLNTAQALARRGAALDDLPTVAGLGRVEDTARLLPLADSPSRHAALALAAQHGHALIVQLLLDAGEDPDRFNPEGFHTHSTPLHQAAFSDQSEVVRLLVERGARLDIQDKIYGGRPLDWATHGRRTEIADYLRDREASRDKDRERLSGQPS
jgi:ankyrin repeat protein